MTDIGEESELELMVKEILDENPEQVIAYHSGKFVLDFFVGQLMKKLDGKIDPNVANSLFKKVLDEDLQDEDDKLTDLEQKFLTCVEKTQAKIDKLLEEAEKALDKAVKLSEKTGVPFYASVSGLGQHYKPNSFEDIWGSDNIDFEKLEGEICIPEYEGWEHSAVC